MVAAQIMHDSVLVVALSSSLVIIKKIIDVDNRVCEMV